MRYAEITESDDLTAEPFDNVDPITRKPAVSYRIMQHGTVIDVVAGRFAATPDAALAHYRERAAYVAPVYVRPPPREKPPVRSMFELVATDTFDYADEPDDFYYHITSRPKSVIQYGLRINRKQNMADGFYATYSQGKIFFCDRNGVAYWLWKIAEHLESRYERPPTLSVVRFPKSAVTAAEDDTLGTRDSGAPAYYVTHPIRP